MEVWKWIIGWRGFYKVSDRGRVRSVDRVVRTRNRWGAVGCVRKFRGRLLAQSVDRKGYLQVVLSRPNPQRLSSCKVHQLVLEAFVGPCPANQESRHLDLDAGNNCLTNLAWGTAKQNAGDKRRRHGKDPISILTVRQVKIIRIHKKNGATDESLAKRFATCSSNIRAINKRLTWRHIK